MGPGKTNLFSVSQKRYELVEGDFVLIWPMEIHSIIDADRKDSLVIQFNNAFMGSMFDMQRIMRFYRNLHVLCINAHRELVEELNGIAQQMKEIFFAKQLNREIKCCMLLMRFMLLLDEHRSEFNEDFGVEYRAHYAAED